LNGGRPSLTPAAAYRIASFTGAWRVAMLATLLLAGQPGRAGAAGPDPVQGVLEFYVNTVDEGTAIVAFDGDEILVASDDLAKAGIRVTGGERRELRGKPYVKLSSLAPSITFAYDEQSLALQLTVDPHLLGTVDIDLQPGGQPASIVYAQSSSAFVNYAINASAAGSSFAPASLFTEQGASLGNAFFDNNLTFLSSGPAARGTTSLSLDDRNALTRTTLGDIVTNGGRLGGVVALGGVGYSKNFEINPYFVPFPTQRFAGVVNTPSTADIYVNGQLVRSVDLPPGQFNLQNIPGATGAGVTRIVVRNAFGQQQVLAAPYYQSTQVLREGLSQYSYNFGWMRDENKLARLGGYQLPAVAATHAFGLTDAISPGGFVQADPRLVVGGPQVTLALPVGQLALFGAGSSGANPFGYSSAVEYSYATPLYTLGTAAAYTSGRYATLSLSQSADRARWQVSSFFGVQLGQWNAFLQVSPARFRDAGRSDQASISLTNRVTDTLNVSLTLGRAQTAHTPVDTSVFLGVSFAFAPSSVATVSGSHSREATQTTAQLSKSLPLGPGYGYLVQAQTGKNAVEVADLQYQTGFGTYEVDTNHVAGQQMSRIAASGAVAAIGGDVKFTTALRDAYALIRVPGAAGVTGYLSNLEIGKTDSTGDLLIPNLVSYYGNRVEINDQDVPIDYSIASTELVIAPGYRAGAVVEFPIHRFQAYLGNLVVSGDSGPVIPAYGDLTVTANGKDFTSPIGEHGEFYLESLPTGTFPATVIYRQGECRFDFIASASAERFVKMGQIMCATR
jgi:outer membrane usher protein